MFRSVQRGHSFNDDATRSGAFNLSTHLVQEVREIDYFGFLRSSFNNGHTIGEHRGHHHIIGAKNRRTKFALYIDYCSGQFGCKDFNVARLHAHRCSKRLETL